MAGGACCRGGEGVHRTRMWRELGVMGLVAVAAAAAAQVNIAAITVATVDGEFESNYDRAYKLATIALNYHDPHPRPQLLLFAETLASGYPSTDVRPFVENVSTSPHLAKFRDLSASASVTIAVGFLMLTPPDIVSKYGVPVRDAVVVFEDGEILGIHTKSSLWPDDKRPWRDERMLYANGTGPTRFVSKLGRFGLLICYENTAPEDWWDQMLGTPTKRARFDFMLSPYDAEGDTSLQTAAKAARYAIPTVWTNRVGTVYEGTYWQPNLGAAGSADATGNITARSIAGVEAILHTSVSFPTA